MMNRTPMSQSYVNSQAGQAQQFNQATNLINEVTSNSTRGTINTIMSQNSNQQNQSSGGGGGSSRSGGGQTTATSVLSGQQQHQAQQIQQQLQNQHHQQHQQQSQQHHQFQQNVPPELTNLLLEFAFSVFVNKPTNIVEYAANYFHQLNQQRQQQSSSQSTTGTQITTSTSSSTGMIDDDKKQHRGDVDDDQNENDENEEKNDEDEFMIDADDDAQYQKNHLISNNNAINNNSNNLKQQQQPKLSFNRRKSVFAEQYDPAADDDDDENDRVVHAKSDDQRARLAKAIQSIFIFRAVDPQDTADILDAMFEVRCNAGDVVIKQGDDGDNFYVVERGKFQIFVTKDDGTRELRGEYEDRGSFGELALMYNQPRAATVVAVTDGSLWAMDRNTFRKIVLKRAFKKRKEYEALFEKVPVLQSLNGYERMNLCDALVSKSFGDGQQIIRQGDQANGMYFVESGRVKIIKETEDGRTRELAILQKGDYFGELALINHKPRAASAIAIGNDVKVAFLDVKAFERLLGPCIDRFEKNCAIYLNEMACDNV